MHSNVDPMKKKKNPGFRITLFKAWNVRRYTSSVILPSPGLTVLDQIKKTPAMTPVQKVAAKRIIQETEGTATRCTNSSILTRVFWSRMPHACWTGCVNWQLDDQDHKALAENVSRISAPWGRIIVRAAG